MTELEQAKLFIEGFNSFITGLSEEQNPYPADGEEYHCWWDGWVDSSEGVIQYYQAYRKFVIEAEG